MTKTKQKVEDIDSEINKSAAKALKTKFGFKKWKERFQGKKKNNGAQK